MRVDITLKFDELHQEILDDQPRKLKRAGSFIRRTARKQIRMARRRKRKRSDSSNPGDPPKGHVRNDRASLRAIMFDATATEAIVGVRVLYDKKLRDATAKTAPELLERGGSITLQGEMVDGMFRAASKRQLRKIENPITKRVRIQRRPFMGPSLDKELDAGLVSKIWGLKK